MEIHGSGTTQIEMDFSKSKEAPEVLDLIKKAKDGDERSFELLFYKYRALLHGVFIQRLVKFDISKTITYQDGEDIGSIFYIIFCECVSLINQQGWLPCLDTPE